MFQNVTHRYYFLVRLKNDDSGHNVDDTFRQGINMSSCIPQTQDDYFDDDDIDIFGEQWTCSESVPECLECTEVRYSIQLQYI